MDMVHEFIARTTPEPIYQAITDPAHIAVWHAEDTRVDPLTGAVEFHFKPGVIRVQISQPEPNHRAVWTVLEGLPGWEGVTGDITWLLTNPFDSGTMVHVRHRGWASIEGPYPSSNFMWGRLLAQMKAYVETGVATPSPVRY